MTALKFARFHSIDLSNFDLSKIEIPRIDMPRIDMPNFEMPAIDSAAVTNVAKDAAYIAIGLAVLTIQKLQVQRRDITKAVRAQSRRVNPA